MSGLIRRSSYLSMVGLSFQSYHSTQSMTSHLLQMTQHAQSSQALTTQSSADQTSADTLHSQSLTAQAEAADLQASASLLQQQASEDVLQSRSFASQAGADQAKLDLESTQIQELEAKIASEQGLYEDEMERASEEASAATSNTVNTQSDGFATSLCEFIPFLDVVCDFVGGVAAVGFESSATELSAQSALDYTAAASLKSQEDVDVTALESLQTDVGETSELVSSLSQQAKAEQIKAEQEVQQAEEEVEQASEKETQAETEQAQSEEAQSIASAEETRAGEEMNKSLQQGLLALKDAVVSALAATVVALFFSIRALVAIVIPGAAAVCTFVPNVVRTTMLPNQYTLSTTAAGATITQQRGLLQQRQQLCNAIPTREASYFILHCGVFVSTLTNGWLAFTTKFTSLNTYDVRSRGGILLGFALVASCLQGFLLHALPCFIMEVKSLSIQSQSPSSPTPVSSSIIILSLIQSIAKTILTLVKAILQLTPLFVIETTTIWLIFGETSIVNFHLPKPLNSENVSIGIFAAAILYVLVFELTSTSSSTSKSNGDHDDYQNDRFDDDIIVVQRDTSSRCNSSNSSAATTNNNMNETESLLRNDYNNGNRKYLNESKYSNDDMKNDIELSPPGEETIETESIDISSQQLQFKSSMKDNNDGNNNNKMQNHHHIVTTIEEVSVIDCESVPLILDVQDISIVQSEIINRSTTTSTNTMQKGEGKSNIITTQSSHDTWCCTCCSAFRPIQTTIDNYMTDLKLPFEILIMTCMIVLLKGSIPILCQLLPRVIKGHKLFFLEFGGVVLVIALIVYYLVRANNRHGNIGLWTGHALRR